MSANGIVLTVRSEDPSDLHLREISLGPSLEHAVRAHGGKCLAKWTEGVLTVVVQGVSKEFLAQYADAYAEDAARHGRHISIKQVEMDSVEDCEWPECSTVPGAIRREKRTRKLLLSLPAGVFVVSNIYPNGRGAFAEKIGSPETRPAAWERAVAAGASQRLCQILSSEDEFIKAKSAAPGLG